MNIAGLQSLYSSGTIPRPECCCPPARPKLMRERCDLVLGIFGGKPHRVSHMNSEREPSVSPCRRASHPCPDAPRAPTRPNIEHLRTSWALACPTPCPMSPDACKLWRALHRVDMGQGSDTANAQLVAMCSIFRPSRCACASGHGCDALRHGDARSRSLFHMETRAACARRCQEQDRSARA